MISYESLLHKRARQSLWPTCKNGDAKPPPTWPSPSLKPQAASYAMPRGAATPSLPQLGHRILSKPLVASYALPHGATMPSLPQLGHRYPPNLRRIPTQCYEAIPALFVYEAILAFSSTELPSPFHLPPFPPRLYTHLFFYNPILAFSLSKRGRAAYSLSPYGHCPSATRPHRPAVYHISCSAVFHLSNNIVCSNPALVAFFSINNKKIFAFHVMKGKTPLREGRHIPIMLILCLAIVLRNRGLPWLSSRSDPQWTILSCTARATAHRQCRQIRLCHPQPLRRP